MMNRYWFECKLVYFAVYIGVKCIWQVVVHSHAKVS